MIRNIPKDTTELVSFAVDMIEKCRVSQANRAAYYRLLNAIAETGRPDNGGKAMINMMNAHLERTAAHMFSPIELKFDIDYDNVYPADILDKGKIFAKHITRHWERSGTDTLFGRGVYEALKYGACFMKQWATKEGDDADGEKFKFERRLVMPWNFGVYREDNNSLEEQDAMVETTLLTMPEVWSRIWNLPHAEKLYEQIKAASSTNQSMSQPDSYFHSVLSSSQLNTNTGLQAATRPIPGGIVQVSSDANQVMGPSVAAETVMLHELWVKGENDWLTIQIIDPNILVTVFKLTNLLIPGSQLQPYRIIQANEVSNWLWGRSELVDLIEPQGWLTSMTEDARRLMGLQIDKFLGLVGDSGMTDETYAMARQAGYMNMPPASTITDLTPKFPPELLPMIKFALEMINTLGSFPEIMQGKGEAGVRAGVHANTLLKTASPTLRDRSLVVERQCAAHADLTASLMEAKDANFYWTDGKSQETIEKTRFLFSQLPDDWRVTVDSHSSSPIFMDESAQEIFQFGKMGIVDGKYMIENSNIPDKEGAKTSFERKQETQAAERKEMFAELKQNPEEFAKAAVKLVSGGKK
jgi:hypothetical protein